MKSILLGLALLVSLPARAFGFGEVFKIETSGTEYCGNFDFARFNSGNNIDLWVRIESDTELSVSLTSNFDPVLTFPMFGRTYLTSASGAAFVAGVCLRTAPMPRFRALRNSIGAPAMFPVSKEPSFRTRCFFSAASRRENLPASGSPECRRTKVCGRPRTLARYLLRLDL